MESGLKSKILILLHLDHKLKMTKEIRFEHELLLAK